MCAGSFKKFCAGNGRHQQSPASAIILGMRTATFAANEQVPTQKSTWI